MTNSANAATCIALILVTKAVEEEWDQRTGCATTVKPLQHYSLTFTVMSLRHVPARTLRADL